jgi:hypothetical protein
MLLSPVMDVSSKFKELLKACHLIATYLIHSLISQSLAV